MFHNWLQIGVTLLIGLLISIPTGRYLAKVVTGGRTLSTGYSIQSTISSTL